MTTKIYGASKPSLEEALEHHGVKGQKWGVRTNHQLNSASRAKDKAQNRATAGTFNANRNAEIDAARARLTSGQTHRDFKTAKKQFKTDKATLGSREARKNLNAARQSRAADIHNAQLVKSGRETTIHILATTGGVALGVGAAVALTSRSNPSI